jgi:cytochrome c556
MTGYYLSVFTTVFVGQTPAPRTFSPRWAPRIAGAAAWFALAALACSSGSKPSKPSKPARPRKSVLADHMKNAVNESFTRVNYLLFHHEGDDTKAKLTPATAQLVRAADRLARDAKQLDEAVQRDDRPAMEKAFLGVRDKCESCHHFFRVEHEPGQSP